MLHLIKLCVGPASLAELRNWVEQSSQNRRAQGVPDEQLHTTRMVPTKREELLTGGSLYWVLKGKIQARQRLLDIRPFKDAEGISRCHLVLEPTLIAVAPRPRGPFQGWRYFKIDDAPADLNTSGEASNLPHDMQIELAKLGLI